MKLYLLTHNDHGTAHFVVGEDAVDASTRLCKALGVEPYFYKAGENGEGDQETNISMNGSWEIEPGMAIDLLDFWMYFPGGPYKDNRIRIQKPVDLDI